MKIHCAHKEMVAISELKKKFHPRNPNEHTDDQIERLALILTEQGVRKPAVISMRSNLITAGHGRILAAEHAGFTHFPVDFQDYESEEAEYSDLVADNAIGAWSELNLANINSVIPEFGPDFNIDLLGIKGFTLEPAEKNAELDLVERKHIFEVVVTCANESEQESIYNRLTQEGLECRVLSM
jgi:hypothetical protein